MTPDQITKAVKPFLGRPDSFAPFVIEFTNGRRLYVDEPGRIHMAPYKPMEHLYYSAAGNDRTKDRSIPIADIAAVTAVEQLPSPTGLTLSVFQDSIRRLRWQRPFQPFAIELCDGRSFDVDDPDAIGFAGRFGVVMLAGGPQVDFTYDEVSRFVEATPAGVN